MRVRFAPSPTGFLHIGGLRTALFNWLFARQHGGDLILRIEDTDRSRYVEGSLQNILDIFSWLDISFQEGPFVKEGDVQEKGSRGPYLQSRRLSLYRAAADELVEKGWAYWCSCSSKRLAEMRKKQEQQKLPPQYDKACRNKGLLYKEGMVLRLRVPEEGTTEFHDSIKGKISVENKNIDDQVLLKSDGYPTYHLAVVVDDNAMGITHVIRGDEWLISTPKHVLVYRAFGWDLPTFSHLPLILAPDKSKLSKRHGSVSVEEFRSEGFLADALINFTALLGWHPEEDEEILSRDDLMRKFSLDRVQKSPAIFNREKLEWMNSEYIKRLPLDDFTNAVIPFLERNNFISSRQKGSGFQSQRGVLSFSDIKAVASVEQTRLKALSEAGREVPYFFAPPRPYSPSEVVWRRSTPSQTKEALQKLISFLENTDNAVWNSPSSLEEAVRSFIGKNEYDNGTVLWAMRFSLTGEKKSPSPFECAFVLGKKESIKRLQKAVDVL